MHNTDLVWFNFNLLMIIKRQFLYWNCLLSLLFEQLTHLILKKLGAVWFRKVRIIIALLLFHGFTNLCTTF